MKNLHIEVCACSLRAGYVALVWEVMPYRRNLLHVFFAETWSMANSDARQHLLRIRQEAEG